MENSKPVYVNAPALVLLNNKFKDATSSLSKILQEIESKIDSIHDVHGLNNGSIKNLEDKEPAIMGNPKGGVTYELELQANCAFDNLRNAEKILERLNEII